MMMNEKTKTGDREYEKALKRSKELEEAIEKQRLLAAELLMTEVRERQRIAADLHDNICQSLAVAKIRLHDLQARATEIDLEKPLIEIKEMISDALHHTRSLLQEISPSILHELGLSAALDALAKQINAKYGLAIILESPQSIGKIDEGAQILLFQAARELLLNIIKHAKVSTASVSIQEIGTTSGFRSKTTASVSMSPLCRRYLTGAEASVFLTFVSG
jgi:signal transduction histidine kinase